VILVAEATELVAVTPSGPMTFRALRNRADLETLIPLWRGLLRRSSSDEPMLSPDWLLTWWDLYGQDREMRVGCWERDGELVGLALLNQRNHRYLPGLAFRRLEPLGSDVHELDGVCSDYLNVIAESGEEGRVAHSFVRALQAGEFGRWDEWVCSGMDAEHPMTLALQSAFAEAGYAVRRDELEEAPFVTLPPTWDAYLATLNKKRRQSLTHALRDFKNWAGDDSRVCSVRGFEDLDRASTVLADLHRQRWLTEGSEGVFAASRFAEFHKRYQRLALDRGELELTWIEVRGEPVAVHYSIVANGKLYFYQTGRKVDVPPSVRLGIVQVIFGLQKAIEQGLREFDFLPGLAQYKSLFKSGAHPIVQLRVGRPSVKESVLRGLRWTAAHLRRIRKRQENVNER